MAEKERESETVAVVFCRDCRNSYEGIDGRICSYGPCVDCVVPTISFAAGERGGGDNGSASMSDN